MNFAIILETLRAGFDWAWRTSLEASVLIALVFLLQWLGGKRLPPRAGYVLWMLVLLRLIMPAVPASRWSIFNLRPAPATIEFQPVASAPASISALPVTDAKETTTLPVTLEKSIAPPATFGWREVTAFAWPAVALGLVGLAAMYHLKTVRRLRQEQPISDPRIVSLVEECREKLGLRAEVPVLSAGFLRTPAVFGWWRARILLPPDMVARLETRELRMVLLHELVHIQRRDVLLNWFVILVRALHWFNPLVWLAVKRLRAERELICDRRVLALLSGEEERRCYGETLLKLLSGFSRPALNPSLVPLLTNKQTLKRRITMIAKYRPASRLAVIVAVALQVPLCCLTFTRAAGQPNSSSAKPDASPTTVELTKRASELRYQGIRELEKQVAELDAKVKVAEQEVNKLRGELPISDSDLNPTVGGRPALDEKATTLEKLQMEAKSELTKQRAMLTQLQSLSRDQLRQSIQTVLSTPDAPLAALLQDHAYAETKLVSLTNDYGPMASEVRSVQAQSSYLLKRIDGRMDGILQGLEIKARTLETQQEALAKDIDQAKNSAMKFAASAVPFYRAKKDLESLQRFRDALSIKLAQEKVDSALPRSDAEGPAYILGQVRSQGLVMVPRGEHFTVAKAIAQAGGFADSANKKKVKLIRTKPDGSRQDFELNIEAILQEGKAGQDMVVQNGDFIFVPERVNF